MNFSAAAPASSSENDEKTTNKIPAPRFSKEFKLVMEEFLTDLRETFPEFAFCILPAPLNDEDAQRLFEYSLVFYPQRFFDILNKNADIFENDSPVETLFLPNVEFKALYNSEGVSEQTRETLWRYLQLILFRIVATLDDANSFGECLKLFENTDMDTLKQKMCDVMQSLTSFFGSKTNSNSECSTSSNTNVLVPDEENESDDEKGPQPFTKDDAERIHSRLRNMLDGKIGSLAKELAEDLSREWQEDILGMPDGSSVNNASPLDTSSLLKKLFSNPAKMSQIVQNVGGKLHEKMKSGEINQEEILKEATGILGQMDNIPGMGDMRSFMKQFGQMMGGNDLGGAMAAAMQQTMAAAGGANGEQPIQKMSATRQMREKMRARIEAKRRAEAAEALLSLSSSSSPVAAVESQTGLTPIEELLLEEETAAAAAKAKKAKTKLSK